MPTECQAWRQQEYSEAHNPTAFHFLDRWMGAAPVGEALGLWQPLKVRKGWFFFSPQGYSSAHHPSLSVRLFMALYCRVVCPAAAPAAAPAGL